MSVGKVGDITDVVADFALLPFEPVTITGLVFQIDFSDEDFKDQIREYARQVHVMADQEEETPSYMVYSACEPGSTKFNAIYGVPQHFTSDLSNVFTIDLPAMPSAKLKYHGDLLEIDEVFLSDAFRFLKIKRLGLHDSEIELIQVFDPSDAFDIWVPIETTEDDPL